jgi:hypothetical protein
MRGCVDRCVAIVWRGCCVIMLRRCVYQVKAVRIVWGRYVVGLFPDFWIWIWWQRPGFNLLEFAVNMLLFVCCMLTNRCNPTIRRLGFFVSAADLLLFVFLLSIEKIVETYWVLNRIGWHFSIHVTLRICRGCGLCSVNSHAISRRVCMS